MLKNFQSWSVGHIKMEANNTAHKLVKAAIHQSLDQVWMKVYVFICDIVLAARCLPNLLKRIAKFSLRKMFIY